MPRQPDPISLHLWKRPPAFRRVVGGGLFALAVLLGVGGQWLLAGGLSLLALTASGASLLASGAVLLVDYQGDLEFNGQGLRLPGGRQLLPKRIRGCAARPGPGGTGELVLTLAFPDGEEVVATGQPLAMVEAVAAAIQGRVD